MILFSTKLVQFKCLTEELFQVFVSGENLVDEDDQEMVDDPKDEDYQHNPRRGVSQSSQTFFPGEEAK
jgi:hypothetical protein